MNNPNIPKHPCANKCTEFKTEQCNHCLIPSNSMELESTESDFLVGDVVVYADQHMVPGLRTVVSNNSGRIILRGPSGKTNSEGFSIRHATVAELHANRRLTEAEHALAEVS